MVHVTCIGKYSSFMDPSWVFMLNLGSETHPSTESPRTSSPCVTPASRNAVCASAKPTRRRSYWVRCEGVGWVGWVTWGVGFPLKKTREGWLCCNRNLPIFWGIDMFTIREDVFVWCFFLGHSKKTGQDSRQIRATKPPIGHPQIGCLVREFSPKKTCPWFRLRNLYNIVYNLLRRLTLVVTKTFPTLRLTCLFLFNVFLGKINLFGIFVCLISLFSVEMLVCLDLCVVGRVEHWRWPKEVQRIHGLGDVKWLGNAGQAFDEAEVLWKVGSRGQMPRDPSGTSVVSCWHAGMLWIGTQEIDIQQ